MNTLFTLPGRLGDNLLKLPIAFQYAKQNGQAVDLILDSLWSQGLVPLLQRESWVNNVTCLGGIISDGCGGQPCDFGIDWSDAPYEHVYHLGYSSFPLGEPCLMTFALNQAEVPIDRTNLYTEPCLNYPVAETVTDLAIHVDASHGVWRREDIRDGMMQVWDDLVSTFEKIYVICRAEARFPALYDCFFTSDKVRWFEDQGDLSSICSLLARTVLLSTDSAIWTLARCTKSRTVLLLDPRKNTIVPVSQHPFERVVTPTNAELVLSSVQEVLSL